MIGQWLQTWEELLNEEVEVLEQLTTVLQEERAAVVAFDLPELTAVTRRKEQFLNRIQSLEASRRSSAVRLGAALRLSGVPTNAMLLTALPDDPQKLRIVHQLSCVKSLAQAVLELNEGQRRFVAHSLVGVEQSLAIIHSLQGAAIGSYYNKDGIIGAELVGRSQSMNQTI